jgi:putative aldouronate transport system permease protein
MAINKRKWWRKSDTQLLVLSIPTLVWYFCFWLMPLFGILVAFKTYRIYPGVGFIRSLLQSPFVGLENFKVLFMNPDTAITIRNTLLYNIVFIGLNCILPVGLALILAELRNKWAAKVYQTILFLPNFLSWVVVATIVYAFLSYSLGMVNQALTFFGQAPINFYTEKNFWPPFLVFLNEWKGLGFGSVIYLAAITGLDKAVYEAAVVDGATKPQQIWYITLPLLKRFIILMLIMGVGGLLNSDIGLFYVVPRDSNSLWTVTTTTGVLLYRLLKGSPIGLSSAAGVLMSVISMTLMLTTNAIIRKVDNESAMI